MLSASSRWPVAVHTRSPIMSAKRPPSRGRRCRRQPNEPLADVNLFAIDAAAAGSDQARRRPGRAAAARRASAPCAAAREALEHGRLANEHPPRLRTHDAKGRRLDTVEFHPSWHWLMAASADEGPALRRLGPPRRRDAAAARRQRRARRRILHGRPDGGRPLLPDHHDQRRRSR